MFECVQICTVSDTLHALQRPAAVLISLRSVSSVRACVSCVACCGRSGLHLARSALLFVVRSPSGCAGGWGLHRRGIQGAPGVGQVSPVTTEKIKKGSKNTPPPLPISKISAKTKKDPYKGSVFCAILALQALKGRNL